MQVGDLTIFQACLAYISLLKSYELIPNLEYQHADLFSSIAAKFLETDQKISSRFSIPYSF
jgi:hypothetical protein